MGEDAATPCQVLQCVERARSGPGKGIGDRRSLGAAKGHQRGEDGVAFHEFKGMAKAAEVLGEL